MRAGRVLHVFPYDPRHLGQTFEQWAEAQLARWPLAAVAASRLAGRSSVHVIGPRARRRSGPPLEIVEHRAVASGPRFRDWGDDWSASLERTLRRLGSDDVCVVHLNDYPAARLAQRAAHRATVVLVLHGRGVGRADDHLAHADLVVALRSDAIEELRRLGVDERRLALVRPSVDRGSLAAPDGRPPTAVLGFVGRLEPSKGVLELPPALAALGGEATVELVGAHTAEHRAAVEAAADAAGVRGRIEILGELPAREVAARMRRWRALALPSHTEGHPLVALEALAAGLPVAAVGGVLPPELAERPGVHVGPRKRFHETLAAALAAAPAPDPWVLGHKQGGEAWDALLDGLPAWTPRPRVRASRAGRVRRLRPLRRAARRALGRGSYGRSASA